MSSLSLRGPGFIFQLYETQPLEKVEDVVVIQRRDAALKFAWWGGAAASRASPKTSVCYAWWCARQSEQKIIVSILRKDHEFQWFPEAQAADFLRLCLYPLYLCMSLQSAVSTDDFRWRGVDDVPLCTDSTSDNEGEMLLQLKPQAGVKEENRQPSLAPHATRYRWIKKKENRWRGKFHPLEPV